jgi:hydrogenase assembly chaperone HypC/HupF
VCLGFPGQVVEVDEVGATVEMEGQRRRVSTLLQPDVAVGDQVFVAGRTIIERLDPEETEEVRKTLLEAVALEEAETARIRKRPVRPKGSAEARGLARREDVATDDTSE